MLVASSVCIKCCLGYYKSNNWDCSRYTFSAKPSSIPSINRECLQHWTYREIPWRGQTEVEETELGETSDAKGAGEVNSSSCLNGSAATYCDPFINVRWLNVGKKMTVPDAIRSPPLPTSNAPKPVQKLGWWTRKTTPDSDQVSEAEYLDGLLLYVPPKQCETAKEAWNEEQLEAKTTAATQNDIQDQTNQPTPSTVGKPLLSVVLTP